jgi:hypothetical protein
MSFFYESFSTNIIDVSKPYSFVGDDTGTPSEVGSDDIFLTANDADCYLSDHVEKHQALWVRYYDGDVNTLTSAKLTNLITKRKSILREIGETQLAGLRHALKGKTRTCKHCDRKQHMVDYAQLADRIERDLQRDIFYFNSIGCNHCNSKSLPFTATIRKREELWFKKRKINEMAITSETTKLTLKAAKRGDFTIKARVGALLHETLLSKYDEHFEGDNECDN